MATLWILIVASLAAINCSIIGTYLVLRKMTMMGDAIAHAVLPGIVIAFLWTSTKATWVVLIGAGSMGLLAALLIEFLHRKIRLQADASIGINFTTLFAIGIILISYFSQRVDLDPDCILYGEVAYVPLDTFTLPSGIDLGPRALYVLAGMLIVNLSLVVLAYKELFITTFDPSFATSIGMQTHAWHYLLIALTSFTTVATFEVLGSILVVALLVAPPATAYLLSKRLHYMLIIASLIGIISVCMGYYLAVWINASIAGSIATASGIIFLAVFSIVQHTAVKTTL